MKSLYIIILLILSSCTQPIAGERPEIKSDIQQEEIIKETVSSIPELAEYTKMAVERWRVATGREWEYTLELGKYHISFGEPPEGYIGFHYSDGSIVFRETWKNSPELPVLILHELGHAFSGDHHSSVGVMSLGIGEDWRECLTAEDVVWACERYECKWLESEC